MDKRWSIIVKLKNKHLEILVLLKTNFTDQQIKNLYYQYPVIEVFCEYNVCNKLDYKNLSSVATVNI